MKTLAARLQHAMKVRNKIAVELARAVSTSEATVSQWLNGDIKSMRGGNLIAVCTFLRCNPEWLASNKGASGLDEAGAAPLVAMENLGSYAVDQGDAGMAVIRRYDTGGSMGAGLVLRDQPGVIQSIQVSREWVEKNLPYYTSIENLAIVTGFGDSMLGMFNPGDPLLVDRGITKADVDGVYFFRVGDEGFIKRLQRIPGEGMVVISENQKYRDWNIRPDMDFEVMAKVLISWQGHKL